MSTDSPAALLASTFPPREIKPGLALITGPRGSGKTRWCMELVKQAKTHGLEPSGLISPAIFEGDQKVGIDLLDLNSDLRKRLAYRRGDADGDLNTVNWQMVSSTLDWGNSILEQVGPCDLFILDEVGPLEFEHGKGLVSGLGFIDAHKSIPCFVVVRPSMLFMAQKRWPWAQAVNLCQEVEA